MSGASAWMGHGNTKASLVSVVEEGIHVALFPFPEQGHVTPMLQLALHLASRGAFTTLITTKDGCRKLESRLSFDKRRHRLRLACLSDGLSSTQQENGTLSPDVVVSDTHQSYVGSSAMAAVLQSLQNQGPPALEKLLFDLNTAGGWPPVSFLVADAFLPWTRHVALKVHLSWIVFCTASATRLFLSVDALEKEGAGIEQPKSAVKIPGVPLDCSNMADLSPVQNPQRLELLQARLEAMGKADYVLLNTFDEAEKEAICELGRRLPISSVGPLCLGPDGDHDDVGSSDDDDTLTWLDKQAARSVVYVCFGSKVVLRGQALELLAVGLEESNRPFLWGLRSGKEDIPESFLDRTRERSKIVSWVPQKKVLEHKAIGAFFTHCGWNSVLEALVEGVPMICWPFFADQFTNRVLIEHKWRVGRGVQREMDASKVGKLVKEVMDDEGLRDRSSLLRKFARLGMEQGGTSYENLNGLFSALQSKVHASSMS